MSLALGIEDNDGPSESAKLCYPAGLAPRGAFLYISENPSEIQGTINASGVLWPQNREDSMEQSNLWNFPSVWQLKHFTSLFQWSHQEEITAKVLVSEERGMK